MVLEVNLHHFVRQPEHDGVARAHPLLHVDNVLDRLFFRELLFWGRIDRLSWLFTAFQVGTEVLEQSNLFLQLFGILCQSVLLVDILPIGRSSLHIVEVISVGIQDDLSGIVEEDAGGIVR